ncbi:MAG: ATP-binding protein, partial [Caldicoprobacterales bacterium]
GIGIPPDKQEIIFNRFQQADGSLTRKAEGSGIGLSLVKALVEMHNGSITLNSEEGKGSEFIIQLPCEVLPDTELRQADNSYDPLSRVDRLHIEFSDIYT